MKGCVISAPMTGSGKTTITLGLLAALRKRGIPVQPFKVGPDFIDPGLHEIAAGVPSHNLDGWMLTRQANEQLFKMATAGKEIAIVEGYLPQAASQEAIDQAVTAAIAETGASSMKDMGAVMKVTMAKLAGKNAEGKMVSETVKRKLSQ